MKIKIDIECTPDEARKFLGLPDISHMQDKIIAAVQDKIEENIRTVDPETLARTWIPLTMQGMSEIQKVFWESLKMSRPSSSGEDAPTESDTKE